MNSIKISIIFLLISFSVSSQNNKIDSLKQALAQAKVDTAKIDLLNELSNSFYVSEPDSAIFYGKKAKDLASKVNYEYGLAYAFKNIGLGNYMKGEVIEVLPNWEQSLIYFEKINDMSGVANLYSNIGAVYYYYGDGALALEYHFKALKVAEDINDENRIYTTFVNIGAVYSDKKETFEKAIDFYKKAVPYLKNVEDKNYKGTLYSNLGEMFKETQQYDSAIHYLDMALALFDGNSFYPHPLNEKAKVLVGKGNISEAVKLQNRAIEMAEESGQKQLLCEALTGLGETYYTASKYNSAIEPLKEALDIAIEIQSEEQQKEIYKYLSKSYAGLNNFQKAYENNELYSKVKDKIYDIETNKKINGLQLTYEIEKKEDEISLLEASNEIQQLETKRQRIISISAGIVVILILILAIGLFRRYKFIQRITKVLEKEKARSDDLLLNILPAETAEELKEKGSTEPKYYESATILFTDFKGFTSISAKMTPNQLVSDLHECFKMFDIITSRYGLEKIKTIGDAYMAAGGIPKSNKTHPYNVALAALEIRNYMEQLKATREKEGRPFFEIRIGLHTGPVVAGVVGIKKFAYDIWGDTVNIAARMESTSEAGRVNISEYTYQIIKDRFDCEYRGEIEAKNRGKLRMYFLNGLKDGELEPFKEDESEQRIEYVS